MKHMPVLCATALALSGCIDAEMSARIDSDAFVEAALTLTATPQSYDFMTEESDPCDNEWVFDGRNYICAFTLQGTLDDIGRSEAPGTHMFQFTREGQNRVRVTLDLDVPDTTPQDDAAMIAHMVAGHAITFRFSAVNVVEHIGGTLADDDSTVLWRIPLSWMILADQRLQDERTALLEF